ncbi:histidine ammonia-lyase [Sporohalobacter salinus]|uniref:histidine ammonia-lyase n=1 Tax=Sporohalobacter salinus TaxID=1494606 RepID=UPI00195FEBFC|nr:histidine ammonia-lyase [Sporohalobacter salinus]MBM7625002.1 histidine ammonia-lyase [Sporohalobacter salinus]
MKKINLNGDNLSLKNIIEVARNSRPVKLGEEAIQKINDARAIVDEFVEKEEVVYGITTGFGELSEVFISKDQTEDLQHNLIKSHACGVGECFEQEVVRAIMLLRINALAKGVSGIRLQALETLIEMLNKGVHPVIPEKGSLGASGDLAPLAHMVLVMIGEGEAFYEGKRMHGQKAMQKAGIELVQLKAKEGLALINGTPVMTAVGALTVYDAINLSKLADISSALTLEALNGVTDAFDEKVHKARPHKYQITCAENLLRLTEDSDMTTRQGELRVQDAYTLRCIPQIHGASRDAIDYAQEKIEIEMNSATDNPLIFTEEKEVISGGNFHGQPLALTFDFLSTAISELANVSERRIERLVNPRLSGLPPFLTEEGGVNSGFMISQYTSASLVSENKVLAHPASVDSIPSSANKEDHVSMGTTAARQAKDILYNTSRVIAVELLAAAQAIDLNSSQVEDLGKGTTVAYKKIREKIDKLDQDRVMYKDINKSVELIEDEVIVKAVEEEIGQLE